MAVQVAALSELKIATMQAIPLDRRHRAKVGYQELKRVARSNGRR
jgi:hypothetical protein